MKLPDALDLGVATHTGIVRSSNEDDYLVVAADSPAQSGRGQLLVVADGMGGVVGGAEASRAAVRALASSVMRSAPDAAPDARMAEGFAAACTRVFELSREMPALREMGTTLTAIHLVGGRAALGHVGDSRALLIRDGELRRLTADHAVREPHNYLTRCIGGGQAEEEPDLEVIEVRQGDRFVLLTDGLWGTVPEATIRDVVQRMPPQRAAEHLVRLANEAGGPDNSTVIVAHVRGTTGNGRARDVELPREEPRGPRQPVRIDGKLQPPRWPWVLLALAVMVAGAAVTHLLLGIDLIQMVWAWAAG